MTCPAPAHLLITEQQYAWIALLCLTFSLLTTFFIPKIFPYRLNMRLSISVQDKCFVCSGRTPDIPCSCVLMVKEYVCECSPRVGSPNWVMGSKGPLLPTTSKAFLSLSTMPSHIWLLAFYICFSSQIRTLRMMNYSSSRVVYILVDEVTSKHLAHPSHKPLY